MAEAAVQKVTVRIWADATVTQTNSANVDIVVEPRSLRTASEQFASVGKLLSALADAVDATKGEGSVL